MKPFVLPVSADDATADFFAATREGWFPLHRCDVCAAVSGPNERCCHACGSPDFTVFASSGEATVVAHTVEHSKPAADGSTHRLTVGIVELAEGPWWWTQVVAPPEEIATGLAVRLEMVTPDGGEAVPVAVPRGSGS